MRGQCLTEKIGINMSKRTGINMSEMCASMSNVKIFLKASF